jgi:hypothetical protein
MGGLTNPLLDVSVFPKTTPPGLLLLVPAPFNIKAPPAVMRPILKRSRRLKFVSFIFIPPTVQAAGWFSASFLCCLI